MLKKLHYILAIVCISVLSGCLPKGDDHALFSGGQNLTEALRRADSIAETGDMDKALANYRRISRQADQLGEGDSLNAVAALNASLTEAQIYFSSNCDYGNVLDALTRAHKISEKYRIPPMPVDFLLGNLYITIAAQNNADDYFDKATGYFVSVLDQARDVDSALSCYAASNLILYSDRGNVAKISDEALKRYFESAKTTQLNGYKFNMKLDSIMRYVHNVDYDNAMRVIGHIRDLPGIPSQRVLPGIYFISGNISAEVGHYEEALKFYKESEKLVDPKHGQDMQLEVFEALENVYTHLGDEKMAGKYAREANALRRQITSFSQISSFKQSELAEEINGMETDLLRERETSRNRLRWSIIGLVFGVLAAIIIGMLLFFMRRMREKNALLYKRYVELLNPQPERVPEIEEAVERAAEERLPEEEDEEEEGGFAEEGRSFTEEIGRIERALSESDEIFSADFSSASLAVLAGVKPRLLSTIISTHYQTSFRNLVNSRRVRAVCRKLETGTEYDNLTVDAIAESIGIRSRTTFTSAFKRETGMTPAQYIRFACERKAHA